MELQHYFRLILSTTFNIINPFSEFTKANSSIAPTHDRTNKQICFACRYRFYQFLIFFAHNVAPAVPNRDGQNSASHGSDQNRSLIEMTHNS